MDAEVDVSRKYAFVLRPEAVTRIWAVLKKVGDVSVTASCQDDTERQFTDPKRLLDFENPKVKQIRGLTFSAFGDDRQRSVHLRLSDQSWSTVHLRLEGPEPTVSRLKDELMDVLDGSKAWYSPVSRVDFVYVVLFLFGFSSIVLTGMLPDKQQPRPGVSFGRAVAAATIVVAALAAVGILAWLLNRLRHRYFPCAAFALGQGQARHTHDDTVRWVVIVGFVVSVFGSLVAAFILSGG